MRCTIFRVCLVFHPHFDKDVAAITNIDDEVEEKSHPDEKHIYGNGKKKKISDVIWPTFEIDNKIKQQQLSSKIHKYICTKMSELCELCGHAIHHYIVRCFENTFCASGSVHVRIIAYSLFMLSHRFSHYRQREPPTINNDYNLRYEWAPHYAISFHTRTNHIECHLIAATNFSSIQGHQCAHHTVKMMCAYFCLHNFCFQWTALVCS